MDGQSLANGSGIQVHQMTVREGVNAAYYHLVKDMREEDRAARMAGHKFDDELEDRITNFEEKIGLRPAHADLALWMHRNVLLPAQGYTKEQIDAMFGEEAAKQLPPGIGEEDRWRFEDEEYDGLKNFEGNPWELPGMSSIQASRAKAERKEAARDVL